MNLRTMNIANSYEKYVIWEFQKMFVVQEMMTHMNK